MSVTLRNGKDIITSLNIALAHETTQLNSWNKDRILTYYKVSTYAGVSFFALICNSILSFK